MPHNGRSVQEVWDSGERNINALQHAALDEGGTLDFINGLSPESRQEAIDTVLGEASTSQGLAECLGTGKSVAECMGLDEAADEDGDGPSSVIETGTRTEDAEVTEDVTRDVSIETDELITRIEREYVDVPTPEKLLDDFFFTLQGFARDLSEAGMDAGDIGVMLDPSSGFLQRMLNEYMGEQSRIAQTGENPYETVGATGEPTFEGTRIGDVSETEITRMTRVEAEEELRRQGVTVTEESIQQTIDDDFATRQSELTTTSTLTQTGTETATTEETGTSRFETTEEIFSRPQADQVFKFTPTEFLAKRFGLGDEIDEAAIGRIATEIGATTTRRQPPPGSPSSISARRT